MTRLWQFLLLCPAWVRLVCLPLEALPEAREVGPGDVALLPGGKEADGIIGDFVLRNDLVVAVVAGKRPGRQVPLAPFGDALDTGCLLDLTLARESNDQLRIFRPAGTRGSVTDVHIMEDGRGGRAAVEVVSKPAGQPGLLVRHQYRLEDGWQGVLITTTLRNESTDAYRVSLEDPWASFPQSSVVQGIRWAEAADPADQAGYACGLIGQDPAALPRPDVEVKPAQELTLSRFLAVAHSPVEAIGVVAARVGVTGLVRGRVADDEAQSVPAAPLGVLVGTNRIPAYAGPDGRFSFRWTEGEWELEFGGEGRPKVQRRVVVRADQPVDLAVKLAASGTVQFDIGDEAGRSLPCKVQFIGRGGTRSPVLGPEYRAHGCGDQYYSERGQFHVPLPPGRYGVIVTRGIEYSHLATTVDLAAGASATVRGTLRRLVDTTGWVSADFHSHAAPSGDNECGIDDRLISLAAEHIEFAPASEHNRLGNWRAAIERLGLSSELATVSGVELTGPGPHLNAFPFLPEPFTQGDGAPVWDPDPRRSAQVLREHQGGDPDRWVQFNHPDLPDDFLAGEGNARGGWPGLSELVDGIELQNGFRARLLSPAPFQVVRGPRGQETVIPVREFSWLQLLNRGLRRPVVTGSDAHSVYGNGVGGWRMYLPSSTDEPSRINWRELSRNAKAGRIILTTGPFLGVQAEDGTGPGGETRASGSLRLKVRVQCSDWVDVDRVQILVNGRQPPGLNFTRVSHPDWFQNGVVKFARTITVPLLEDSHLIVVAFGEHFDLATGYGTSAQAGMNPCAFHDPIYVDVDGGGFKPNGDALGWPLRLPRLNLQEAKALLEAHGL